MRAQKSMRLNGSAIMMNAQAKKRDPWIGQTVKITKGSWKGYLGIVKATTDRHLQVKLHAKIENGEHPTAEREENR
eukprot:UN01133